MGRFDLRAPKLPVPRTTTHGTALQPARHSVTPDMILITGASGNIGKPLAEQLRHRQVAHRVARHAERSASGTANANANADTVRLDFREPATFAPALRECDAVFLLRPPAISNTRATLNRFVDAARAAGVRQIVFISVAGAGDNPLVPHHAVERRLRADAGGWTILRPGFFSQNLGDAYRDDIVEDDRLFVPAGAGRVAFVDTRDIAEVAALALTDPASHSGCTHTLTGPRTDDFADAAALLTQALGRPIRYQPASIAGYAVHLRRRAMPWPRVAVQTVLHVGLRFGQAARVDGTLPALLGRPARTLSDYVHDHATLWRAGPPA